MSEDTQTRDSLPEDDALTAFLPPKKRRKPPIQQGSTGPESTDVPPTPDAIAERQAPIPEQPDAAQPAALDHTADAPNVRPRPEPQRTSARIPRRHRVAPEPPAEPAASHGTEVDRRPQRSVAEPAPVRPPAELGIQRVQGSAGGRITQCTVNVSVNVRDRFAAYQLAKKLEKGSEPTNAVVVIRAIKHVRRRDLFAQMLESIRHRQAPVDDEDDDPDGLFGDVQGRRVERGRARDMAQQSFRPSYDELAVIDALTAGYGFANRSEFLDAALDAFLPQLPEKRRRS